MSDLTFEFPNEIGSSPGEEPVIETEAVSEAPAEPKVPEGFVRNRPYKGAMRSQKSAPGIYQHWDEATGTRWKIRRGEGYEWVARNKDDESEFVTSTSKKGVLERLDRHLETR